MIDNLQEILEKNKDKYKVNKPFSHIRLENLFPEKLLDDVVNDINKIKDDYEWNRFCTTSSDFSEFGESTVKLTNYLISNEWVDFLSKLTDIPDLFSDNDWLGSGINFEKRGSHLEPHTDFNRYKKYWRRVNLLLFLSKDWKDEWGGHNELGRYDDDGGYVKVKSYKPDFNTVVIFNTSDISYHAFDIVRCPDNVSRVVISCYYYSEHSGPHTKNSQTTNYIGWDKERQENKEYHDRHGTGWRKLK